MAEYEYAQNLDTARSLDNQASEKKRETRLARKTAPKDPVLSFKEKISKYWPILAVAAIFDLLAAIPFISVLFNIAFAGILFLYFGPKTKDKSVSELQGIVLPAFVGSAFDWILSILPVNIGTAVIRIALHKE
jgi:hypothetical protein